MEKSRSQLLEALSKKGMALCEMYHSHDTSEDAAETLEEIRNVYNEIVKFVEPSDSKVASPFISLIALYNLT